MPSRSSRFKYLLLVAPILLSACGEGWTMIRVDNMVPYGNTRTAGSGVAYVRAKMLPPKTVDTAPAAVTEKTEVKTETKTPDTAVKSAEPVFSKKQQK